jgi:uncharacterized protein (UPF0332 family)
MGRIENMVEWCMEKADEKEPGEHRGLKKTSPDRKWSKQQEQKAVSDLDTMQYLYEGGKTDWVAPAAFYAMYHALLAILALEGYESRNQECTIALIEKLVQDDNIDLDEKYITKIRSVQSEEEDVKTVREEMQYGAKTELEEARCQRIMDNARTFVDRVRVILAERRQNNEDDGERQGKR